MKRQVDGQDVGSLSPVQSGNESKAEVPTSELLSTREAQFEVYLLLQLLVLQ